MRRNDWKGDKKLRPGGAGVFAEEERKKAGRDQMPNWLGQA